MRTAPFLCACLVIVGAIISFHQLVQSKTSGLELLQLKLALGQKQADELRLKQQVTEFQFQEFRQQVAAILPSALENHALDESAYPLRNLASVVSKQDDSGLHLELASSLFEKAKGLFRDQVYDEAAFEFSKLIDNYPASVHVVEAYFLRSECFFQLQEFEKSVESIQVLLSQYPESELTGFALLRLGKIFEKQERLEDAAEIYQAVLGSFPQPDLKRQAKLSLKAVAL